MHLYSLLPLLFTYIPWHISIPKEVIGMKQLENDINPFVSRFLYSKCTCVFKSKLRSFTKRRREQEEELTIPAHWGDV